MSSRCRVFRSMAARDSTLGIVVIWKSTVISSSIDIDQLIADCLLRRPTSAKRVHAKWRRYISEIDDAIDCCDWLIDWLNDEFVCFIETSESKEYLQAMSKQGTKAPTRTTKDVNQSTPETTQRRTANARSTTSIYTQNRNEWLLFALCFSNTQVFLIQEGAEPVRVVVFVWKKVFLYFSWLFRFVLACQIFFRALFHGTFWRISFSDPTTTTHNPTYVHSFVHAISSSVVVERQRL